MIELLVLDVDGCLSDGKITFSNSGEELKSFNVKDGFGLVCWQMSGRKAAIITGKSSKIVESRAKELGIKYVFQGVKDKLSVLAQFLDELEIKKENVAAIGDDLNDLRQLKYVGWSFAPADAMPLIKENVKTVLDKKGGRGAVREMIDVIIEKEGQEKEFYKHWL